MPYGPRSARTAPLPPNWGTEIRPRILARDHHACRQTISYTGELCGRPATDVDHIGDPHDHADANLRALCQRHHRVRSAAQGGRAAAARRVSRQRPADPHPGMIT